MARKSKSSKKTRTLLTAALAFAASPQGRKLLQQAKEYAARPETKAKASQLLDQAKTKARARRSGASTPSYGAPGYGTPPASDSRVTPSSSSSGTTSTNPL